MHFTALLQDSLVYYVAILKPIRPVHLEIQTHRAHPVGVLRSSFRQGDKIQHTNHGRITGLWELSSVEGPVDVEEHCYLPMDRLLERQRAIQRTLASKHLKNAHLVLYDITSTYFEGAYVESEIVLFGYNRDGKKGHEQV